MYRKSAVEIIANTIDFYKGKDVPTSKIADRALKNLEDKGMKPPDRQRCFCHDCNCSPNHTWEPENEKSGNGRNRR